MSWACHGRQLSFHDSSFRSEETQSAQNSLTMTPAVVYQTIASGFSRMRLTSPPKLSDQDIRVFEDLRMNRIAGHKWHPIHEGETDVAPQRESEGKRTKKKLQMEEPHGIRN